MHNLSFSAQLLQECRDLAAQRLGTILPDLMDKVDDALFDLADKGENNQIQTLYFDAMREVRLRRATIEADFRICLADAVNDHIQQVSKAPGEVPGLDDPDTSSFLLVENDELEESLAVNNMAGKTRSACKSSLFLLDKRMAFLLDEPDLAPGNNPIGPEVICGAFKDACRCIEAEIDVKLLVLKLFDRFVVQEMETLYNEINDYLIKRDVLPNLKATVEIRRNAAGQVTPDSDASTAEGEAVPIATAGSGVGAMGAGGVPTMGYVGPQMGGVVSTGVAGPVGGSGDSFGHGTQGAAQALLSALQTLMRAGESGSEAGGPGGIPFPSGAVSSPVIGALTALQSYTDSSAGTSSSLSPGMIGPAPGAVDGAPRAFDLRSLKGDGFAELMGSVGVAASSGAEAESGLDLGQMNEMMIDIVAMMFDYILDDENLAPPMRALIGRLQIPVLKVAILDRTLFSRRFHPARKLLNAFAEAAFGWDESAGPEDPLHRKMDELIHRILDEFDDDVAIFASVLESLQAFNEEEERERQRRIEHQAAALERRERLQDAKQAVKQEVRRALDGVSVPLVVKRFITRYWGGNLVVVHMKHGSESQPWASAVQTMDHLIWSVTPKDAPEERARLIELLPTLLKRVNDGVAKVSMPSEEREELVSVLAARHAELVRSASQPADTPDDAAPEAVEKEQEPPPTSDKVASLFGGSEVVAEAGPRVEDQSPSFESELGELTSESLEPAVVLPTSGQESSGSRVESPVDTHDDTGENFPNPVDAIDSDAASSAESIGKSDPLPAIGPTIGDGRAFVYPEQDLLVQSIARANRLIYDTQLVESEKSGMATTLVAAIFRDNRIHYAHVGDSRLYRFRGGRLTRLTRDHSLMQELIDKGFYSPEEAAEQVNKNLVTRGLGVEASVESDVGVDEAAVNDLFLLCSDGLTDMIEDRQLEAVTKRYHHDPDQLVDVLIKTANDNGGRDNISALVALVNKPFPSRKRWYVSKSLSGKIHFAGRTDIGQRRPHNEDSIAIAPGTGTLMVADGMGGLRAGEVASAMAVRTLMEDLGSQMVALSDSPTSGAAGPEMEPGSVQLDQPDEPAGNPNDIDLFSLGDISPRAEGDGPVDSSPPLLELDKVSDDDVRSALQNDGDAITGKMLDLLDCVETQVENIVIDEVAPICARAESTSDFSSDAADHDQGDAGSEQAGQRGAHIVHIDVGAAGRANSAGASSGQVGDADTALGFGRKSASVHPFGEDDPDLLAFTQGISMRSPASGDEDEDSDEYERAARELAVGNWVELELEPGKTSRARLSWFNQATGVYLFTDRRGLQVAERSLNALAVELRRGSARILETVPLYDRAVTSLMDHLRNGTDGG